MTSCHSNKTWLTRSRNISVPISLADFFHFSYWTWRSATMKFFILLTKPLHAIVYQARFTFSSVCLGKTILISFTFCVDTPFIIVFPVFLASSLTSKASSSLLIHFSLLIFCLILIIIFAILNWLILIISWYKISQSIPLVFILGQKNRLPRNVFLLDASPCFRLPVFTLYIGYSPH